MKFTYQSYEQLLKYHDELDVINRYYPIPGVQKQFKSPLRIDDKHPSAHFYPTSSGRLQFNDFKISVSVLGFLSLLFNISIHEAEKMVLNDFSGGLHIPRTKRRKYISSTRKYQKIANIPTIIQPIIREFRQYDIDYWNKGGITLNWLTHPTVRIYPASKAHISGKKGDFTLKLDKMAYVYCFHKFDDVQRYKIYQPNSKSLKWISNSNSGEGGVFQGWETLPKTNNNELLIISSSLKDSGVIECNLHKPSGAPNNEGAWLPPQILPKINQRFIRTLTWFDNDDAGHRAAAKFKQKYGFDGIFIPEYYKNKHGIKDQFEFRAKFGKKEFIQLSNYLIYEKS